MTSDLQFILMMFSFTVLFWIIANHYIKKWQERELEKYLNYLKRERIKRERTEGENP